MQFNRYTTLLSSLALLLFSGCAATNISVPELAMGNHPANPNAPAAPLMSMSQTLASSGISSTPVDAQAADGMQGMEHGSMSGMDHSSMENRGGMDQSSMEGMNHDSMQETKPDSMKGKENMPDTKQGSMKEMDPTQNKVQATEATPNKEQGAMEGMDHGSMGAMDGMTGTEKKEADQ